MNVGHMEDKKMQPGEALGLNDLQRQISQLLHHFNLLIMKISSLL